MPLDKEVIACVAKKYGYESVFNKNNTLVSYRKAGIKQLLLYHTTSKNTVAIALERNAGGNGQRFLFHTTNEQLDEIFRNPVAQYENGHTGYKAYKRAQQNTKRAQLSFQNTDANATNQVNSRKRKYTQMTPSTPTDTASIPRKRFKYTTSSNHNHKPQWNDGQVTDSNHRMQDNKYQKQFEYEAKLEQISVNVNNQDVEDIQQFDDDQTEEQIPCDHVIDYELFAGDEDKANYCSVLEQQVRAHQKHKFKEYKTYLSQRNEYIKKGAFPYRVINYDYTPTTKQVVTFECRDNSNQYKKYGMDALLFCSCALNHREKCYESLLRSGRILNGKVVSKDGSRLGIRIKKHCQELHEYSGAASNTNPFHDPYSCRFMIDEDKFKFITIQIQLRGIETFLEHVNDPWFQYFYRLRPMPMVSMSFPFASGDIPSTTQITSSLNKGIMDEYIMDKYKKLNPSQVRAISNCVLYPCSLVQGPPGTGKTYTACHIIDYLLSQNINQRVLMTAHTHCAVDQFLHELIQYFPKYAHRLVRIGAISKVDDKSKPFCLDNKIKQYKTEYDMMQNLFQQIRYERNRKQKNELRKQAMDIKDTLCRRALEESSIILGTCYGCCNKYLTNLNPETENKQTIHSSPNDTVRIDCVLFDESTQIHEPEMLAVAHCLYPYRSKKRIVMIGDPQQLSPITPSRESKKYGYNLSIFERLLYKLHVNNLVATLRAKAYSKRVNGLPNFVMLNVQYRGYDVIHEWSNQMFYEGKLIHHTKFNANRRLIAGYNWKNNLPINFVHIESQQQSSKGSWINVQECEEVLDIAMHIVEYHGRIQDTDIVDASEIGIITPYKAQQRLIDNGLKKKKRKKLKNLQVSTVDAFQGQQKKLIIYSMTRTDAKWTPFTSNAKRVNVAFTRSKFGLLVVGNVKQLRINVDFWRDFKTYLRKNKAIDECD